MAGGLSNRVARFSGSDGAYLGDFVLAGSGGVAECYGTCLGPDGNLYVSSASTNQVLRYDGQTGIFLGVFVGASAGLTGPYDLTLGPDGALYASAAGEGVIYRFDGLTGAPLGRFNPILMPPVRGIGFGPSGNPYACS